MSLEYEAHFLCVHKFKDHILTYTYLPGNVYKTRGRWSYLTREDGAFLRLNNLLDVMKALNKFKGEVITSPIDKVGKRWIY